MTRLVCTDLDAEELLSVVLDRLSKEGVLEVYGEGAQVSTVGFVVAKLKAEHSETVAISNVSGRVDLDDSGNAVPKEGADDDDASLTVCLRSQAPTCKKVQARARSYTTLRTAPTAPPLSSSANNSPSNAGRLDKERERAGASASPQPPPNVAGGVAVEPVLPPPSSPPASPPPVPTATATTYASAGGQLLFPDGIPAGGPGDDSYEDPDEPPSISPEDLTASMPEMPQDTDFHTVFHACHVTGKRPADRYFPKSGKALCLDEAKKHYAAHPDECIAICYDLSDYGEVAWNYKADRWTTLKETEHFEDVIEVLYETKGAFMVSPVTEKHTAEVTSSSGLSCASTTMQGWRSCNEDAHAAFVELPSNKDVALFGVYDGHGGWRVADYAGRNLHRIIDEQLAEAARPLTPQDAAAALKASFLLLDEQLQGDLCSDHTGSTGSTVNVVLVIDQRHIVVANAGDTRSVMSSQAGSPDRLSHDHKPDSPRELDRILKSGSRVSSDARVEGMLAVSRAVGDFDFKQCGGIDAERQAVTADPTIEFRTIGDKDSFILQACDGIWDVMTDEQAVGFVTSKLKAGRSAVEIITELCDQCMSPTIESEGIGTDNMTVNLIVFPKHS